MTAATSHSRYSTRIAYLYLNQNKAQPPITMAHKTMRRWCSWKNAVSDMVSACTMA